MWLERRHVRVAGDDEHRGLHLLDVRLPGHRLLLERDQLLDQRGEAVRVGSELAVVGGERHGDDHLDRHLWDGGLELRLPAAEVVGERGRDELVHLARVADGELKARFGAHRITEDVGLGETDGVHEGSDVVGEVGVGDGPVDVVGAAVALEFERVDAVRRGELRNDRAHGRDVHVGAVQHDQRVALAGHLVVHLHAANGDALARRFVLAEDGSGDQQGCGYEDGDLHGVSPFYPDDDRGGADSTRPPSVAQGCLGTKRVCAWPRPKASSSAAG